MSRFFSPPLTGRHVLLMLVAFFGVVFAANGAFVYFARSTWTGVERDDAYRQGLHYNSLIAEAEAQKKLGWKIADLELTPSGAGYVLILRMVDAAGAPLHGLRVSALVRRAATDAYDTTVTFAESMEGAYRADVALPEKGQWLVDVTAERDGSVFRADDRMIAP